MTRPIIAVAIGDPAGVGPEIALRAAADGRVRAACRLLLVGDAAVLEFYHRHLRIGAPPRTVVEAGVAVFPPDGVEVLDVGCIGADDFDPGVASAACGRAILAYAGAAVDLARAGDVDAVAAGPHTQKAIHAAGVAFDGYPGFVARRCGMDPDDAYLMLVSDRFRIVHVTLHEGLRAALDRIDRARVLGALRAADKALRGLGIARPRIAVAGVNPHAGEDGLFGREEIEQIAPAVADAVGEGIDAHGPFGADTMFLDRGYDAYLVMYHDQGHVPAKLVGFATTSAFTIGAPVRFASVAHGSAHDIAGQGHADPSALIATLLRLAGAGDAGRGAT